jgi:acyl-coenzyme A synthetase/AMP-(fatty) acid ligase
MLYVEFNNAYMGLRRNLNKTSFTAIKQCRIRKEEIKEMTYAELRENSCRIKGGS